MDRSRGELALYGSLAAVNESKRLFYRASSIFKVGLFAFNMLFSNSTNSYVKVHSFRFNL